MATKAKAGDETQVEEKAAPKEESGPVVLHGRTTTDEHFYSQFGSAEEAEEEKSELRANAPGKYEFETLPLTDFSEILDANPPPPSEEDVEAPQTVAQASKEQAPAPGIPDRTTLESMTRQDLNVIAKGNDLDPADFDTNEEIIDALDDVRP